MFDLWLTRIVLSLEPDAKKGPWWAPFLLSTPAASLMAADADSGAHATHSTVWSWSRNSYNDIKKEHHKSGQWNIIIDQQQLHDNTHVFIEGTTKKSNMGSLIPCNLSN